MSPFKSVYKLYQSLLSKHPLKMQAIQAGTLMGAGDLIAQCMIEKKEVKELNFERTVRYGSVGIVVGPILQKWFGFLEQRIGKKGFVILVKKVSIDQLCFAPCFLAFILTLANTMQGKSLEEIKYKLKNDYPDILAANYMLWPWVQLANFSLVPLAYRVIVIQSVAVSWNIYISWKLNKTAAKSTPTISSKLPLSQ